MLAYVCVSGCVCVWFYACYMITVGVLVFVESCVWLFLFNFTILLINKTCTVSLLKPAFITMLDCESGDPG